MEPFFIGAKLVVAHLRFKYVPEDASEPQLALTVDGVVWERRVGGWKASTIPVPEEGEEWLPTEQIEKAQVSGWLAARLAEGWRHIGQ